MTCYNCHGVLIWKGETDCSEDFPDGEFNLHTTLVCESCKAYVEVYADTTKNKEKLNIA